MCQLEINSVKFVAVIGVVGGYEGEKLIVEAKKKLENKNFMENLWQDVAHEYFKEKGVSISAVYNEGKAIYDCEFGSPKGGEIVGSFSGDWNTAFESDFLKWKMAVEVVVERVAGKTGQCTWTTSYMPSEFHYHRK